VRDEKDYFAEVPNPRVPKEMLELAEHILETKAGHFDPKRFKDEYELALRKLVKRKAAGKKIEALPPAEDTRKVINLMMKTADPGSRIHLVILARVKGHCHSQATFIGIRG
jgi:DNA end-binding protein Ku